MAFVRNARLLAACALCLLLWAGVSEANKSKKPSAPKTCTPVYVDQLRYFPKSRNAQDGQACGAAVAQCAGALCCSQTGTCSADAVACDGTCQCAYSGPKSNCTGKYPIAPMTPSELAFAAPGGVCGEYTAKCPRPQCCSAFGFCTSAPFYCSTPACKLVASPFSPACRRAHQLYPVGGSVVRYTVNATVGDYSPDGNFSRAVILTNGGYGNLVLRANVGDRIVVTFNDQLPVNSSDGLNEGASIHWHGVLQTNSATQDGVVLATQRPSRSGRTFTYSFIAQNGGTFWWHSHYSVQYVDGLRGALVIHDPMLQPAFASEPVVTLTDFYPEPWSAELSAYLSPSSEGDEPVPRNGALNGVSQDSCLTATDYATCRYAYVKATVGTCDRPNTRVRIINAGGQGIFNVSVDAHVMKVIAVDAVRVDPVVVGSIRINNGQRYDVLLCRADGTLDASPVFIRAMMPDSTFPSAPEYNLTLGVLYYTDAPPTTLPPYNPTPSYIAPQLNDQLPSLPGYIINPSRLTVFSPGGPAITPPGPATLKLTRVLDFYTDPPNDNSKTQLAYFDNVSLNETGAAPSLLERIFGNPEGVPAPPPAPSGGGLYQGWNVIQVPNGAIVDIIINNHDNGEHPLHIHGHFMWVMARGPGDYAGTPLNMGTLARDTTTVNANSHIVLRFFGQNPGAWIYHCHIDWHLAAGLGWIFQEII